MLQGIFGSKFYLGGKRHLSGNLLQKYFFCTAIAKPTLFEPVRAVSMILHSYYL
jgi:hypothetical protein